ncbi:nucleotidyl transferase AbiEii/AbiGii toxin family protein [Leucobacter insecticola]|uniref:Nucleotidyl transferase AbiEii/AbiGii toxin family protein n=1 Tax=Leucobacter insecticola TaxID=2714934 RepID=A0A6G8FJI8_9MICO|nr:nucleotidyl transferase AbiEii/AbiGii toxin family protein [Leucobacter insecticola]QIM16449.1 nucleotidyl transferase AbiEii/AbiGii toxin family protein [Leucobacter insecticola]
MRCFYDPANSDTRHSSGQAYNDLRNLARRDGRDPAEYFTLYALEGFLARLAVSEYAGEFVLKGGVLMAAFAARRPTRDIDFAATGFTNDITDVEERVRSIIEVHLDDGLEFDSGSAVGEPIQDDADYNGVRVKITAQLATAKVALHVDVNFGDPIWPAPTEAVLPLLLGGTLRLRGYPAHPDKRLFRWADIADESPATCDLRASGRSRQSIRGWCLGCRQQCGRGFRRGLRQRLPVQRH